MSSLIIQKEAEKVKKLTEERDAYREALEKIGGDGWSGTPNSDECYLIASKALEKYKGSEE